jgi:hypothetical protein
MAVAGARAESLEGKRFGRLIVLSRVPKPKHINNNPVYWLVKCDCGTEKFVSSSKLVTGNTKSCGCLRRESTGPARKALWEARRIKARAILNSGHKKCLDCLLDKSIQEFSKAPRFVDGLNRYCFDCIKNRYYLREYGITRAEKQALIDSQGGLCANSGCGTAIDINSDLDHDHSTGKIRGVLCSPCNTSLGKLKESTERLIGLVEYLDKFDDKLNKN